jgi:glutamate-1-semialdehyde 2,1-aminomutase
VTIQQTFAQRHPRSAELHARGVRAMPSGINHDGRFLRPFQVYVDRAHGVYKTDVDGNRLLDYVMGHGALLLGHSYPAVADAVSEQATRGTHFGACSPLELGWAERVVNLVPCAEEVRFTMSGTEATLLAMRLARAFTGRRRILKFEGHFHGWHDYALIGDRPPFDRPPRGVPEGIRDDMVLLPVDLDAVQAALRGEPDIAAIILEPSGASWATVPLPEGFLAGLRSLADEHGVLLIFDEVVSGFRWSPGGIQQLAGVLPDLTTLAKIVSGGLPGGAVCGRRDVMQLISFDDRERKIIHQGTFNANPLSAAAGCACLDVVQDPAVQHKADALAGQLRRGLNEILCRLSVPGCAYGESSAFHLVLGIECAEASRGDVRKPDLPPAVLKAGPSMAQELEMAMLNHGVHLFRAGGFTSAVSEPEHVAFTLGAFEASLRDLRSEGLL